MEFAVTPVPHGAAQLLRVRGELDVATVQLLGSAVEKALAEQPGVLLVDLTETRFIDSTGCRELVRAGKAGQVAGVAVEVVVPLQNWKVRRVVELVQLTGLVPVHDRLPPAS